MFLFLSACGTVEELQVVPQPTLNSLSASSAAPGDVIAVYGNDFSPEQNNIVLIGGIAIVTTTWSLTTDAAGNTIEQIVFTVPSTVPVGEAQLSVMVDSTVSNALPFTVISP